MWLLLFFVRIFFFFLSARAYLIVGPAHSIKVTSPPCRNHANKGRLIMPKVVIEEKKGLVQQAGSGFEIDTRLRLKSNQTIDAPAAAAATDASTINTGNSLIFVTQANDANDRIYLPSPTDVPLGHVVIVVDTEGAGFELSSKGDGTTATTINGVAVTGANGSYLKELAVSADQTLMCTKVGANAWMVGTMSAVVPD